MAQPQLDRPAPKRYLPITTLDDLAQHLQWALSVELERELATAHARYLAERRAYYSLERRWPASEFWSRRRSDDRPDSSALR